MWAHTGMTSSEYRTLCSELVGDCKRTSHMTVRTTSRHQRLPQQPKYESFALACIVLTSPLDAIIRADLLLFYGKTVRHRRALHEHKPSCVELAFP